MSLYFWNNQADKKAIALQAKTNLLTNKTETFEKAIKTAKKDEKKICQRKYDNKKSSPTIAIVTITRTNTIQAIGE